jgi:hypothetical protein
MQEECTSPSYWSEVIGERWSCLGESVYYLIPIRVCFNRRSLTVAPTCHLAMSPDGGRAIRREDRGGGVISPISSPSLVDPDSVGVSTPHPPLLLHRTVGSAPGLFSLLLCPHLLVRCLFCLPPCHILEQIGIPWFTAVSTETLCKVMSVMKR